jgi:hypothetical protein
MATTNLQGDHLVSLEYENDYEFKQKTRPHSVQANLRAQGDVDQNRTYILPDSLHAGGFEGKSTIPLQDRTATYNSNYTTGKMDLARRMRDNM